MKKSKILKAISMSLLLTSIASSLTFAEELNKHQKIGRKSSKEIIRSNNKIKITENRFNNLDSMLMILPDVPPSKRLSTSGYIPQPDGNTCGPTAAHNLLLNWGADISLSNLKRDLLYDGQTPFGDHWSKTLNKYSNSDTYVVTWSPSRSTIWNASVGNAIDGHGTILDTHMSPSNGYLVGYSGSYWWHYVTGIGYSGFYNSTNYVEYFDPYDGRQGTYGVHRINVDNLPSLLKDRGMVW